jgi:hypothetical protein
MRVHVWAAAVLVLAGASLPAHAQTTMAWKFTEGEKLFVEEISDQKVKMSLMGKEFKIDTKTTKITSYTVKRAAGAATTLEMKIESLDVKAENNPFGGMEKMQEKLVGATFTVTLDGDKITKFEGFDAFMKRLAEGDENFAAIGKQFMTEDMIKKDVEELFTALPKGSISKGHKWDKDLSVPMGPLGTLKNINHYVYKGAESDGDLVTYTSDVKWAPGKGGDLFKVSKATLKSDNARGSFVFDSAKGRLVRGSKSMTMSGTLTLDVMGNEIEMEMSQDSTSTLRVLTRNPKKD